MFDLQVQSYKNCSIWLRNEENIKNDKQMFDDEWFYPSKQACKKQTHVINDHHPGNMKE